MTTTALLLAEPETESRDVLERHLRDDGFEVLRASFRSQALTLAERERPHLVLASDPDLCRSLREGEPGRKWDRDVPLIVLVPEEADPVDRVRALERGAGRGPPPCGEGGSRSPARSSTCSARSPPSRSACSRRPSSCATSGGTTPTTGRGRSTLTRRACA